MRSLIIIAVENCFEKPNSAREIVDLAGHFAGNPAIGLCYDTGHANIMDFEPWKDAARYHKKYTPDFRSLADEWWEGLEFESGALAKMKDNIVTCHIHDNNGYNDLHGMPFAGTVNWPSVIKELKSCPIMVEFQTEVCFEYGFNRAGPLLTPEGGYSSRELVETFHKLGF